MIKLTTALLTLGVGVAIATTAIAQDSWWAGCNPQAPGCRALTGSDDPLVSNQRAPGYGAPTHHRSMYMYAPRRGGSHRPRTNY